MENAKKPKIFIVEDNADIREIYRLRFEVAGMEVVALGDGLDFVSRVAEEVPDIILLDLMLPEMDGYMVLKTLKENMDTTIMKQAVIIVWSNLSQDEDVQKALFGGASYYLRKSDYDGDDLVDKVKEIYEIEKAKK